MQILINQKQSKSNNQNNEEYTNLYHITKQHKNDHYYQSKYQQYIYPKNSYLSKHNFNKQTLNYHNTYSQQQQYLPQTQISHNQSPLQYNNEPISSCYKIPKICNGIKQSNIKNKIKQKTQLKQLIEQKYNFLQNINLNKTNLQKRTNMIKPKSSNLNNLKLTQKNKTINNKSTAIIQSKQTHLPQSQQSNRINSDQNIIKRRATDNHHQIQNIKNNQILKKQQKQQQQLYYRLQLNKINKSYELDYLNKYQQQKFENFINIEQINISQSYKSINTESKQIHNYNNHNYIDIYNNQYIKKKNQYKCVKMSNRQSFNYSNNRSVDYSNNRSVDYLNDKQVNNNSSYLLNKRHLNSENSKISIKLQQRRRAITKILKNSLVRKQSQNNQNQSIKKREIINKNQFINQRQSINERQQINKKYQNNLIIKKQSLYLKTISKNNKKSSNLPYIVKKNVFNPQVFQHIYRNMDNFQKEQQLIDPW